MTGKSGEGASERQWIDHVVAVSKLRLAAARSLNKKPLQDPDFISRRFDQLNEALDLAHQTIAALTEQLFGEAETTPSPILRALRSHSSELQPVHLDINGRHHTLLIPPQGRDDPAAAAQLWRRLRKHHREGGA